MVGSTLEQAILRSMLGALTLSQKGSVDRNSLTRAFADLGLVHTEGEAGAAVDALERGDFLRNGDGRNIRLSGSGIMLSLGLRLPPEIEERLTGVLPRLAPETPSDSDP